MRVNTPAYFGEELEERSQVIPRRLPRNPTAHLSSCSKSRDYEYITYAPDVYCLVYLRPSTHLSVYSPLSASGESFTYRTPHPLPQVTSAGFEISSPPPPRRNSRHLRSGSFPPCLAVVILLSSSLSLPLSPHRSKITFTCISSSNISLSISSIVASAIKFARVYRTRRSPTVRPPATSGGERYSDVNRQMDILSPLLICRFYRGKSLSIRPPPARTSPSFLLRRIDARAPVQRCSEELFFNIHVPTHSFRTPGLSTVAPAPHIISRTSPEIGSGYGRSAAKGARY